MLSLSFHIGTEDFAIPVNQVAEVLPLTALQKILLAPEYIAGLLDYHGTPVPVVDLCALLTGNTHSKVLTTRIMLIKYQHHTDEPRLLGLIAERVTETIQISDNKYKQTGLKLVQTPYLGTIVKHQDSVIQLINADALLTDEVHNMLYQDDILTISRTA